MATPRRNAAQRGFLDLPAGPAIAFLASAACLLGGVASLLAPGLGDPDGAPTRLAAFAALGVYWLALFAVALLLERWRRANPDAVGVLALIALFAVAGTIALDVISLDVPRAALAGGVGAFAIAAGMYRVLARRVLGAGGAWFAIGLALLFADDALTPAALALHAKLAAAPVEPLVAWRPGLLVALAGLAALVVAAGRSAPDAPGTPAVRTQAMRWSLALIAVAATAIHQWSLDHIHSLGIDARDAASAIGLAALVIARLRSRWRGRDSRAEVAATLAGPLWAMLWSTLGGAPSWASPYDLLACAAIAGVIARRERCGRLAAAAALAATMTLACRDGGVDVPTLLAGTAVVCAATAIARRDAEAALAAALGVDAAVALTWTLREAPHADRAGPIALFAAGATLHAFAARWTPRFAVAAVAGGALMLTAAAGASRAAQVADVVACTLSCGVVAWRRRSRAPLAPLLLPAGMLAPRLVPRDPAWGWIGAAFALLGGGTWWARHRATPPPPTSRAEAPTPLSVPALPP